MSQELLLLAALGFLIVMMVFNNRKRKKMAAEMQGKIKVGAYVLLHSGILGSIVDLDDKQLVVETTPGTKLTVLKGAVRSVEEAPKKSKIVEAKKPAATKSTTATKPAVKKPATKTAK